MFQYSKTRQRLITPQPTLKDHKYITKTYLSDKKPLKNLIKHYITEKTKKPQKTASFPLKKV